MNGNVIIGKDESYALQGKVREIKRCKNEKGKIMDISASNSPFVDLQLW